MEILPRPAQKERFLIVAGFANRHTLAVNRGVAARHTRHQQLLVNAARSLASGTGTKQLRRYQLRSHFPMRTECDDPVGLHSLPAAENPFHHRRHVVVAQGAKYTPEVFEGQFVPLQQCLLRGVRVRPMKGVGTIPATLPRTPSTVSEAPRQGSFRVSHSRTVLSIRRVEGRLSGLARQLYGF
jgi:hypothetical protein